MDRGILKNHDQVIANVKPLSLKGTHKFGVLIPRSVKQELN